MDYLQLLKDKINDSSVENSKEILGLLSSAEAELLVKSKELEKKLKQFYKAFGEDESSYPEKARKIAEFDMLADKLEKANEKISEVQKENKLIARESSLTKQCIASGIDQDALKLLLADDVEITDKGVLKEGKEIPLDKFIEADAKLSKFKASLYLPQKESSDTSTEVANVPTTGIPKGKGKDTTIGDDYVTNAFNNYLDKYWGKSKATK